MSSLPDRFTRNAARMLLLAAQGIEPGPHKAATRRSVLQSIRQMGQLQIDTISVVNRSPYLVLHSRIGDFRPIWLEQLLEQGKIFEAWSHEASFLPIEDYPYAIGRLDATSPKQRRYREFVEMHRERAEELIERMRTEGPVRSRDFDRSATPRSGGWWSDRKHEKKILEGLFADGTVMIVRRENFQRVYGLREMVLPGWEDHHAASMNDADDFMVEKSVAALGIATARWIPDYYRMPVARANNALHRLVANGTLLETEIEQLGRAYVHHANISLARKAARGKIEPQRTVLLSPFDPVVWHRLRAEELFEFEYRIECYTPAEKRIYGYFTLPILHRGNLVGRLDSKAHRSAGWFEVKSLHLESDFEPTQQFVCELAETLLSFAAWHDTAEVKITATNPPDLQIPLIDALHRQSGNTPQISPVDN